MSLDVAIIGAGFGGLGFGYQLITHGIENFRIFERNDGPGGTWRDNAYPGCGCDVPSHLYWYSFDAAPDWSRHYALQPEILENIEHFVERKGLAPYTRYGTEVKGLTWNGDSQTWSVALANGETVEARYVVGATGQLSTPTMPSIPGVDDFAGTSFHSARWNRNADLKGKRVAVIGTGATAAQIIPAIAPEVGELVVVQRSPAYVVPRMDRPYTSEERKTFRAEREAYEVSREEIYRFYEAKYPALKVGSEAAQEAEQIARAHLEEQVKDPELREKLWPDYDIGCKRVLISDDFYPALTRDNVVLETGAIDHIGADGLHMADGTVHALDVIIYATGFDSQNFLAGIPVTGEGGRSLRDEAWKDGAEAYRGVQVAGFPNLFLLYGPNTNLNHNSIIAMMEPQTNFILALMHQAHRRGAHEVAVKQEAMDAYNDKLRAELDALSFGSNCHSWYKNAAGKVTNNWSLSVDDYEALMAQVPLEDFDIR